MTSPEPQVTELLRAWGDGDEDALGRLMPLVHQELRRLAGRHMAGERVGHTLQPTALVNEAYLRLIGSRKVRWQDRAHFYALSSQLMRRTLVDYARSRQARKRGGDWRQVTLDEPLVAHARGSDLVALDDALSALAEIDPRKARVVELRYFGGMTARESAETLGVSEDTVLRDWKLARVWLMRELDRGPRSAS